MPPDTAADRIPAFLSAQALLDGLRRGAWSSQDLLEHFIARIERFDGPIRAVVVRDFERARIRARESDAARALGESWGPLHGLPMTVKESFDVPGLPTTCGYPAWRDHVATEPAEAVRRLQAAGAIVFGKTNVPKALADWQSFNAVYGTTANPWDLGRTPGGSSGGSAAALAAGLTGLELGSDIGASIRNPAHYCGVWGHKPTWGVVPVAGHGLPGNPSPDALDIAVAGPMARSAHDLTLAMDVLVSPLSQWTPTGALPARWRDDGRAAPLLRVAIIEDDPVAEVDAPVRQAIESLAHALQGAGFSVGRGERPVDSEEAWEVYVHLLRAATGARMDDEEYADAQRRAAATRPGSRDYGDWNWRASTLSHRDWVRYDRRRTRLREQWAAFFERWDLLICPIATTDAFEHAQQGWRWERMVSVNGRPQPGTQSLFWAGYPGLCGLPATAVPIGQSPRGLPIGAQIVGPLFADPVCLRLARWIETHVRGFVPPPGCAHA